MGDVTVATHVPTIPAGLGDIRSTARGSGARYNAGKPPLELIPAGIIAGYEQWKLDARMADRHEPNWIGALEALGRFQMRVGDDPYAALYQAIWWSGADWQACARVFHFGKTKYAAWNWTKGMPWSVPLGCAMRHVFAAGVAGEQNDPDSKDTHAGHFMCNVVMLLFFVAQYPEGDDLYTPPTPK